jgi:hypothetical protein
LSFPDQERHVVIIRSVEADKHVEKKYQVDCKVELGLCIP